jgi:hypothetical protein
MNPKFFGSKLNTVLLLVLIVLMVFALRIMLKDKETYLPGITLIADLKEYKNEKLGLAFSYPESFGEIKEKINEQNGSFEYELSFDGSPVQLIGKSNPYISEGRGGADIDLTEDSMKSVCNPADNQKISSKNKIEGIYAFTQIAFYDSCEDVKSLNKNYYAVFDTNTKIQNVVIVGYSSKIEKETFLDIVNSLEIK